MNSHRLQDKQKQDEGKDSGKSYRHGLEPMKINLLDGRLCASDTLIVEAESLPYETNIDVQVEHLQRSNDQSQMDPHRTIHVMYNRDFFFIAQKEKWNVGQIRKNERNAMEPLRFPKYHRAVCQNPHIKIIERAKEKEKRKREV